MDAKYERPIYRASTTFPRVPAMAPPAAGKALQTASGPLQLTSRMLQNLAPLPDTATRLLALLNDPEVSLQRVADIASRDVGITAAFLRMANSPLFGLRGRIGTVTNAIRVIGMVQARLLVLASGVSQIAQRDLAQYGLVAGVFMRHSEFVANLTMSIAQDRHYPNIGLAYTAGLLHDIGKVILNGHAQRQGVKGTVEARLREQGGSLSEAEQALFGADHAEIGRQLTVIWVLPEEIGDALAHHHTVDPDASQLSLAAYVRLANQVACTLDAEYPAAHHPVQIAIPAWINMEKMDQMAIECGFSQKASA